MDVLYFDNHLVVVNKPGGVSTQAEEGDSVEKRARLWAKQTFQKTGDVFLYAVHRLDKPVSGILLLAKTSKALIRLHESFRERKMKKTYVALVEGRLEADEGVFEDYLKQTEFRTEVSFQKDPKAKQCRLVYKVLQRDSFYSLVEIDLQTGRYHQIRCQFAARGHPIVGDRKYGAKFLARQQGTIALHHQKMQMIHPTTKELLTFKAPLPKNWQEWTLELAAFL
jgi:23S rRNA pseudouridine1911/1915/1917 synthase